MHNSACAGGRYHSRSLVSYSTSSEHQTVLLEEKYVAYTQWSSSGVVRARYGGNVSHLQPPLNLSLAGVIPTTGVLLKITWPYFRKLVKNTTVNEAYEETCSSGMSQIRRTRNNKRMIKWLIKRIIKNGSSAECSEFTISSLHNCISI